MDLTHDEPTSDTVEALRERRAERRSDLDPEDEIDRLRAQRAAHRAEKPEERSEMTGHDQPSLRHNRFLASETAHNESRERRAADRAHLDAELDALNPWHTTDEGDAQ